MNELVEKLTKLRKTYMIVAAAHHDASRHYERLNYIFGVPVVVISTLAGATIVASIQNTLDYRLSLLVGIASLVGAVLASLQMFFGFSERAQSHKTYGTKYSDIKRRLDYSEAKFSEGDTKRRSELEKFLEELLKELAIISDDAPGIPDQIYNKTKDTFKESQESGEESKFGIRHHGMGD